MNTFLRLLGLPFRLILGIIFFGFHAAQVAFGECDFDDRPYRDLLTWVLMGEGKA